MMPPRIPVPRSVWMPIADRLAHDHGITVHQLRFEGRQQEFFIPRAKFWKALRALPAKYSLGAIGDVTGNDHTSVLSGLRSPSTLKDYDALMARVHHRKDHRPMRDLTGERFGMLVVEDKTSRPAGGSQKPARWWTCLCDCGCRIVTSTTKLTTGRKYHCGQHRAEVHRRSAEGRDVVRLLTAAAIAHPLRDAA
jgi:hypothetical protein